MKKNFTTKDLQIASVLLTIKQDLIQIHHQNGIYYFEFFDEEKCQDIVDSYWRGDIHGNLKGFADAINDLKKRIFNK